MAKMIRPWRGLVVNVDQQLDMGRTSGMDKKLQQPVHILVQTLARGTNNQHIKMQDGAPGE
eukprot:7686245-Lingulodinium_polyedra.AAC.1